MIFIQSLSIPQIFTARRARQTSRTGVPLPTSYSKCSPTGWPRWSTSRAGFGWRPRRSSSFSGSASTTWPALSSIRSLSLMRISTPDGAAGVGCSHKWTYWSSVARERWSAIWLVLSGSRTWSLRTLCSTFQTRPFIPPPGRSPRAKRSWETGSCTRAWPTSWCASSPVDRRMRRLRPSWSGPSRPRRPSTASSSGASCPSGTVSTFSCH